MGKIFGWSTALQGKTNAKPSYVVTIPACTSQGRKSQFAILLGAGVLSVALPASAQPAALHIVPTNGQKIAVQWNTPGALQTAPSLNGPWLTATTGVAVASSLSAPASGSAMFFRVVDNGVAGAPVPLLPNPFPGNVGTNALPVIQSADIQLLPLPTPTGNTRLQVTFQSGQPASSNVLTLLIGNQLTTLHDDGTYPDLQANDGVFSGLLTIGVHDFDFMNNAISNLPPNARFSEVFDNHRALVGTNILQLFPNLGFQSGSLTLIFTNLPQTGRGCDGSTAAYRWWKTLLITNLSVVEDPTRTWDNAGGGTGTKMGAWTFGKLMTDMANTPVTGIDPSDFVLNWLRSWETNVVINFDTVSAVTNVQHSVVDPWLVASQSNGLPAGKLDLSIAPFRLLAIVNRIDLHGNTAYGAPLPHTADQPPLGGEGRFVFGVTDMQGVQHFPFTVILEYGVPRNTCPDLQAWAQQWAALDSIAFGSSFNAALQAITDQFAAANANPAHLPNQSAINQVRANEMMGFFWTLREWRLSVGGADAGWLVESPVKQTPAMSLYETATLASFIADNSDMLCNSSVTIPLTYNGAPFLGGAAVDVPIGFPGFFWNAPSLAPSQNCARHSLSLNTCNGCHVGETRTSFLHISPRDQGTPSGLSGFLLGETVPDPVDGTLYTFKDLDRRVGELNRLAICPCLLQFPVGLSPVIPTH
jgi:hypothetical protein